MCTLFHDHGLHLIASITHSAKYNNACPKFPALHSQCASKWRAEEPFFRLYTLPKMVLINSTAPRRPEYTWPAIPHLRAIQSSHETLAANSSSLARPDYGSVGVELLGRFFQAISAVDGDCDISLPRCLRMALLLYQRATWRIRLRRPILMPCVRFRSKCSRVTRRRKVLGFSFRRTETNGFCGRLNVPRIELY
ncbi:hypothetical protein BDV97DRAFT_231117 [Delphinella strobiligena]|nr:hypothetical protein BDV97DRAFT_231117 [Delphinella strobiligena]